MPIGNISLYLNFVCSLTGKDVNLSPPIIPFALSAVMKFLTDDQLGNNVRGVLLYTVNQIKCFLFLGLDPAVSDTLVILNSEISLLINFRIRNHVRNATRATRK